MELRHLRYFNAIAEALSFTRAAERLHVSQPTLSHQIRQLENEIGVVLFERVGRRVRLTEAGDRLRRHMAPALAQIDSGLQSMKTPDKAPTQLIRVGTTPSFNTRVVPGCVATFFRQYPGSRVSVHELLGDEIVQRLHRDELDMGVAYQPPPNSELWFEPLYTEQLRLVVEARHPLARRRRVRVIELHQLPLVTLPEGTVTRRLLDDVFAAAGAQPLVLAQFSSIAATLELVRFTELAAIMGETAVPADPQLRSIPLHDPSPTRTPGLLWKRGATGSPTIRHLADIIRETVCRAA